MGGGMDHDKISCDGDCGRSTCRDHRYKQPVRCSRHPRYLAKRKPRADCEKCLDMWEAANQKAKTLIENNTPVAFRLAARDRRILQLEHALAECLAWIELERDPSPLLHYRDLLRNK